MAEPSPTRFEDQPWKPEEYEPALSEEADKLFKRELLVARKAAAEKRYDDAITHYTQALSTGRNDAQCLGERGYVRLLKKQFDEAGDDLWFAAGAVGSDRTLAQVWYNLGLTLAEQAEPELSRAAFARSLALAPSSQAKAKLGQQSHCGASVQRAEALGDAAAQIVKGWLGVHKFLGSEGEPKTESEARQLACATQSQYNFAAVAAEANCTDAPPWSMSCCAGFGHFLAMYMMVYPRANNRFFAINYGMIGGWPRACQGAAMPEATIYGRHLVLKTVDSSIQANTDFDTRGDPDGNSDPPCRTGPRELQFEVYDLDTAKRLLQVRSLTPGAPQFEVNAAGTQATLRGADCDATLTLP